MVDVLQRGSDWLERMRLAHLSSPAEYRRTSGTVAIRATCGRTAPEFAGDAGPSIGAHGWDFLVAALELGAPPEPGDEIVFQGRRHEVMDIPGEGCWRWSDPFRRTYRIHTKDTGSDA